MTAGLLPEPHSRVLVVEDDWIIAADLADALETAGYEVLGPACSVAEALVLVRGDEVDLAVLDVHLTQEMSFPVAEALIDRKIPFIFVSGLTSGDLPPRYRGFPLLSKPVPFDRLMKALRPQ